LARELIKEDTNEHEKEQKISICYRYAAHFGGVAQHGILCLVFYEHLG
jgi:hypothetical protein